MDVSWISVSIARMDVLIHLSARRVKQFDFAAAPEEYQPNSSEVTRDPWKSTVQKR
jgi:hypothetical protein